MPISFADQDLLLVPPELQAFLDRYLPTVETVLFSDFLGVANTNRCASLNVNAKNRVGIARPNYPAPPKLKINSLYWPTGAARWGRFLGICNTATKDKILESVGTSSPVAKPLTLVDESQSPAISISHDMHLLPPRRLSCLTQSSSEDADQCWLMPLVDKRWHWQFPTVADYSVSAGDTWLAAFLKMANALNASIDADEVRTTYLYPDPLECSRRGESPASLLDAIAHSVGHRIVLSGDDVMSLDWDRSKTRLDANLAKKWTQVAGGEFDAGPYATQKLISLICPKYVTQVQSCGLRQYDGTIQEGSGTANTSRTIHSTVAVNFDTFGDVTPANDTELQALTDRVAADQLLSMKFYDRTFNGLLKWDPVGWDDHIEWNMGVLADDGTYVAQTRVQSHSYNFGIDEMLHQIEDRVFPPGNYIAKTTTSIPQMTGGTTPGTGEADLYEWSGTALANTDVTVSIRNMTPIDVPNETFVHLNHDGCQLFVDEYKGSACQSLDQLIQDIDGYDPAAEQALTHVPESAEGEDDGCLAWLTIDECGGEAALAAAAGLQGGEVAGLLLGPEALFSQSPESIGFGSGTPPGTGGYS